MNYYQEDVNKILEKLKTTKNGLTSKEALERQKRYGKNELPKKKHDSVFKIFLRQILDPIVIILIATIVFSLIIGAVFGIIAVNRKSQD